MRQHFPYKVASAGPAGALVKSNKELVQLIGGRLEKSLSAVYPDLDAMNACAIRLSYCLNKAGLPVGQGGVARIYAGKDTKLYTISADEMISYMKSRYGKPVKKWDGNKKPGANLLEAVKVPTQGIIGYDWQGRTADFGASGHIDIGKMIDIGGQVHISLTGTGQYFISGPMLVYMWECTA